MVFSSHIFLFYFLPLTLLGYYAMVRLRCNISWVNLFVTIASYAFYGWFQPYFIILMWITTFTNYMCGRVISKPGTTPRLRNTALVIGIVVSIGFLAFFKYYMFAMGGINRLIALCGAGSDFFDVMKIALPIGISFYTFQALSYTIDVWRGDAPPVKDLKTFSCFVALFPQLIAGPIIRYNTVADQLSGREHSFSKFSSGAAIFILGFAKKILLANAGGAVANAVFRADAPDMATAWWGVLGYHFQIYFDFCAYSDMAVGLGRMMGFEFIKNFNGPYRSVSISDFWNRWHISLSTWIKDYLYVGLGGNRRGPIRTYINLGISMFLCGLWHGAQTTFVIWGIFHGALLIWERTMGRQALYRKMPVMVKILLTNILVMLGWVMFRAPSMDQAFLMWKAMLGLGGGLFSSDILRTEIFSVKYTVEMIICAIIVFQPFQAHEWVKKLTPLKIVLLTILFVYAIVAMFTQAFNPFLYFQF